MQLFDDTLSEVPIVLSTAVGSLIGGFLSSLVYNVRDFIGVVALRVRSLGNPGNALVNNSDNDVELRMSNTRIHQLINQRPVAVDVGVEEKPVNIDVEEGDIPLQQALFDSLKSFSSTTPPLGPTSTLPSTTTSTPSTGMTTFSSPYRFSSS